MSRDLLVVDDDPSIRRLITTTLEDVAECRLLEADDGDQALELANRHRPEIVLLDVDIPGPDGIEVCCALRANPRTSEATIVMLTASHHDAVEARAEAAGADLFLTKPFSPLELLRLVDGLSARWPLDGQRPARRRGGRDIGPADAARGRQPSPDQHDRVEHEQQRECDRPAVQVALDQRAAAERALTGTNSERARQARVLARCIRIRKISPTHRITWTRSEPAVTALMVSARTRRPRVVQPVQDLHRLRPQRPSTTA